MSTLLGPLLSLWIGVSEPDAVPVPPPPPLPLPSERALFRVVSDWVQARWPFRVSPLADDVRAIDADGAITTDPAVLKELEAWSKSTRPARTLSFEFDRYIYDFAAGTESRGPGVATSEGKQIRIEVRPYAAPRPGIVTSGIRGRDGRPLRVIGREAEQLTSDERAVFQIGPAQQRTHIATFPPQMAAADVATRPFFSVPQLRLLDPFYQFDAAARARAYRISFGNRHQPGRQIHLVLVGTSADWQREFDRTEVLLKADTYEPMAIRWIEPGATRETIYVFKNVSRK